MRILLLMSKVDAYGAQHHGVELVRGLLGLGHRVEVVCPESGWFPEQVRQIPAVVHPSSLRGLADLCRLVKLLRSFKPEVMHTHCSRADYFGLVAARLTGVPVVATAHIPRASFRLKHQNAIIAVSNRVRRALTEAGARADRIHVVHNGIDASRFTSQAQAPLEELRRLWSIESEDFVVALIGVLHRQKGQDVLIQAAAIARGKGTAIKVLLVGDPFDRGYVQHLHDLVRELGLGDRVQFTGRRSDVPSLLAIANVVVLPSRDEALGISLLEGMAAGLPVVGSCGEGAEDVIEDGRTGFLVPYGDGARLAEVLIELWGNPGVARAMGARGRGRVQEEFSNQVMTRNVVAVYNHICSPGRSRSGAEAVEPLSSIEDR